MEQSREVGLEGEIEEPLERGGPKAVKPAEGAEGAGARRPSCEAWRGRGVTTVRGTSGQTDCQQESACRKWVDCLLEANSGPALRKNTRVLFVSGFGDT